jgi:hypothetical protein
MNPIAYVLDTKPPATRSHRLRTSLHKSNSYWSIEYAVTNRHMATYSSPLAVGWRLCFKLHITNLGYGVLSSTFEHTAGAVALIAQQNWSVPATRTVPRGGRWKNLQVQGSRFIVHIDLQLPRTYIVSRFRQGMQLSGV